MCASHHIATARLRSRHDACSRQPAGACRHRSGSHQPGRAQGLAGGGLHGSDRRHEHRLSRRRGAGSGRQGRPRQYDVGAARRGCRRPRFARLPGEAGGSEHRALLRRRIRTRSTAACARSPPIWTRRSISSASRSPSRASMRSRWSAFADRSSRIFGRTRADPNEIASRLFVAGAFRHTPLRTAE